MLSFQEIFSKLPVIEEKAHIKSRYLYLFIFICAIVFFSLLSAGSHWNNRTLLYTAWVPLVLMPLALLLHVAIEAWMSRQMFGKPEKWMLGWLDHRFADERKVASEVAQENISELKRVRDRLDAELLTRERWLEILKPFSILIPAALILAGSEIFHLPSMAQNFFKLAGAAMLSGLTIGAISVYAGLVKLRRLLSTLQYAISLNEERKQTSFRKISRKRGKGMP